MFAEDIILKPVLTEKAVGGNPYSREDKQDGIAVKK